MGRVGTGTGGIGAAADPGRFAKGIIIPVGPAEEGRLHVDGTGVIQHVDQDLGALTGVEQGRRAVSAGENGTAIATQARRIFGGEGKTERIFRGDGRDLERHDVRITGDRQFGEFFQIFEDQGIPRAIAAVNLVVTGTRIAALEKISLTTDRAVKRHGHVIWTHSCR